MKQETISVLGIHPSSYGFGWAFFDHTKALRDWGTADIRGTSKNTRALIRLDRILQRHKPSLIALEMFAGEGVRRRGRIRQLYRAVVKRAAHHNVIVRI